MLILTRRAEEKIKIGDNIVVSVFEVDGNVVKLGIDAPRDIPIYRMEVLEQIEKKNIEAASKTPDDIADVAELFKQKFSGEQED